MYRHIRGSVLREIEEIGDRSKNAVTVFADRIFRFRRVILEIVFYRRFGWLVLDLWGSEKWYAICETELIVVLQLGRPSDSVLTIMETLTVSPSKLDLRTSFGSVIVIFRPVSKFQKPSDVTLKFPPRILQGL